MVYDSTLIQSCALLSVCCFNKLLKVYKLGRRQLIFSIKLEAELLSSLYIPETRELVLGDLNASIIFVKLFEKHVITLQQSQKKYIF